MAQINAGCSFINFLSTFARAQNKLFNYILVTDAELVHPFEYLLLFLLTNRHFIFRATAATLP